MYVHVYCKIYRLMFISVLFVIVNRISTIKESVNELYIFHKYIFMGNIFVIFNIFIYRSYV